MPQPVQEKTFIQPAGNAQIFFVKFGDGMSHIFNPDCNVKALLHCIKKKCNCDFPETVDLADDQGTVKNLHQNLKDYATEHITDREALILLKVDRDEEEDRIVYVPLLDGMDEEFTSKLNPKPRATSRQSRDHETGGRGKHGKNKKPVPGDDGAGAKDFIVERRTSLVGTAKAAGKIAAAQGRKTGNHSARKK